MLQEYKNNYQKCIAWQLDFKVSVICGYVMLQHMTWYGQYDRVFVYGSADYTNKQTIYLNNTAEGYNSRGLICIYWESVVIFQSEHLPVCSIMTFTKYWFKMNVIYCKLQCNFHSKFPYQLKLMSVKSIFVCGHDYAVRLNTLNMLLLQKKKKMLLIVWEFYRLKSFIILLYNCFSFRYWVCQKLCQNGWVCKDTGQSTGNRGAFLYQ